MRGYKENGRLLILSYLADHYKKDELINEIKKNEYFPSPPNSSEIKILEEKNQILAGAPSSIAFNYPSFLSNGLSQSLGTDLKSVMKEMQKRAPLYLRVNLIKNHMTEAQKKLAVEMRVVRLSLDSLWVSSDVLTFEDASEDEITGSEE